jgi:hypothetical protein
MPCLYNVIKNLAQNKKLAEEALAPPASIDLSLLSFD